MEDYYEYMDIILISNCDEEPIFAFEKLLNEIRTKYTINHNDINEIMKIRTNPNIIKYLKETNHVVINYSKKDYYSSIDPLKHIPYDFYIRSIPVDIFNKGYFNIYQESLEYSDKCYSENIELHRDKLKLNNIFTTLGQILASDKTSDDKIEYIKSLMPINSLLDNPLEAINDFNRNSYYLPGFGKEYFKAKNSFDKLVKEQLDV